MMMGGDRFFHLFVVFSIVGVDKCRPVLGSSQINETAAAYQVRTFENFCLFKNFFCCFKLLGIKIVSKDV
jgi:hypothetical protein